MKDNKFFRWRIKFEVPHFAFTWTCSGILHDRGGELECFVVQSWGCSCPATWPCSHWWELGETVVQHGRPDPGHSQMVMSGGARSVLYPHPPSGRQQKQVKVEKPRKCHPPLWVNPHQDCSLQSPREAFCVQEHSMHLWRVRCVCVYNSACLSFSLVIEAHFGVLLEF